MILNTSSVFISLEIITSLSLLNKIVQQIGNAQIHLPSSNFNLITNNNTSILIQVCFANTKQKQHFHLIVYFCFLVDDATTCNIR